jgi:hypothetical protein
MYEYKLNGWHAKGGQSAESSIDLSLLLSSQRKAAMERKWIT